MQGKSDIKIKAITLSYVNYRESDRILTLFSPETGLVTATAFAARRVKSEIRACSERFFFGDFVLSKSAKGYFSVKSADLIDVFYDLRTDMNNLSCATYMCDFIRETALEEQEHSGLFLILIRSLSQLCYKKTDYKNVKLKFELSAMELLGFGLTLDKCGICKKETGQFFRLSGSEGGIVCASCGGDECGVTISAKGLATLRQIKNMPEDNISVIKINDKTYAEINAILKRYISWHIERTFKSATFLENNYIFGTD